jgi:hypothetical protein
VATKFRKRMPSEKHYDRMLTEAMARYDSHPSYSEEMAVSMAVRIVRQRREADRKAIGLPAHWPIFETPLEHGAREVEIRSDGTFADDAVRVMFEQDVQAWRKAEPTWNAHEITVHIMDRGYYVRYGYSWGLRIARELMGETKAA